MLIDSQRYRALSAGAHRCPAPPVSAPSLVWHLAFWNETCGSTHTSECCRKDVDIVLYRIFMLLATQLGRSEEIRLISPNFDGESWQINLFRNCFHVDLRSDGWRDASPPPHAKPGEQPFIECDVYSVTTPFQGLNLTVRANLHAEYWTLTFFCDLHDWPANEKESHPVVARICSHIRDVKPWIETRISERWNNATRNTPQNEYDFDQGPAALIDSREILVKSFRNFIKTEFLSQCMYKTDVVGRLFADISGVVFGLELNTTRPSGSRFPRLSSCDFHSVGNAEMDRALHEKIEIEPYSNRSAMRVVDAAWPLLKSIHSDIEAEKRFGKAEFTISRIDGGKSIYITTLGRVNPNGNSDALEPVTFTLVVGRRNRCELGLLLEKINMMSTSRLAALFDFRRILHVNDALNVLSSRLIAKNVATQALFDDLVLLDRDFGGSVALRFSRSSHYIKLFREILRDLDFRRIEGFEKYPDFAQRRFFRSFDFIGRIGDRYVDLEQKIFLMLGRSDVKR